MPALTELRSLPNLLSTSRPACAAACLRTDSWDVRNVLVMAALSTDCLVGWIARQIGPMTRIGALLDPFTDRVFALVGVSTFLFEGTITTIEYFVMISRDLMN